MKNKYLNLANKNLSNNFTGNNNMSNPVTTLVSALDNKFSLTIKSTANRIISVGVLPSYFKTLGISSGALHYHNKQALIDSGIVVDAIVDDGIWDLDNGEGAVTIYGNEPTKKIRDFLEYIKFYTPTLSLITIHSANVAAYRGSLRLQQPNPYYDSQRMPVDLNRYFSVMQYHDNKIDIPFSGVDLKLTPDLLFIMPVPANSIVSIDFVFSDTGKID